MRLKSCLGVILQSNLIFFLNFKYKLIKMKLFKLATFLFVLTAFACSPKYYKPNTQQITLFEEEGDINLTGVSDGNRYEVQAAYAFTDQFAGAVNYSRFVPVEINDGDGGSGYIFEVAPGYYKSVGDNLIFEAYAQLGIGKFENTFSNPFDTLSSGGQIQASAFKLGLQPSIAYKQDKIAIALSSRFSSLNYANIEGQLTYNGVDQVEFLEDNKSNFLIEPALTFWFGFEKVKLQAQYALSFNVSNADFPRDKQLLSIGINANLNKADFND